MLRKTILLILVAVALLAAFAWLSGAEWGPMHDFTDDDLPQSRLFVWDKRLVLAHDTVPTGRGMPGSNGEIITWESWGGFECIEWRDFVGPYAPVSSTPVSGWQVRVPLWSVILACSAYPAIAFIRGPLRRWRRRKRGLCIKCGYDLTGNVPGACPECAHPVSETASQ